MKRNLFLLSTLLTGLLTATSCSDEQIATNPATESGSPITVTASATKPQVDADTRVTATENGDKKVLEVRWRTDTDDNAEKFSVLKGEETVKPNLFTYTSSVESTDNKTANFDGEIYPYDGYYYALYPKLTAVSASAKSISIHSGVSLGDDINNIKEANIYMYGKSKLETGNVLHFPFKHLTSVLKVTLSFPASASSTGTTPTAGTRGVDATAALSNVKFTTSEGFIIRAEVDITGDEAVITPTYRYSISASNVTLANYNATVYLHVISGAYSGIKVSCKVGDATYSALIKDYKEIKPGVMYTGNADMVEIYEVEASELTDASDIKGYDNIKVTGDLTTNNIAVLKAWAYYTTQTMRGLLDLSEATFPNNAIPENGFEGCLCSEVILPEGLETIGAYAFCDSNVESINIPSTVTNIGQAAFNGTPLQEITIPSSVETLGYGVFENSPVKGITFLGDIDIPTDTFCDCYWVEKITILGETEKIGPNAFNGTRELKEIHLGATEPPLLDEDAFYRETNYPTVYVPTEAVKTKYLADSDWSSLVDAGTIKIEVEP